MEVFSEELGMDLMVISVYGPYLDRIPFWTLCYKILHDYRCSHCGGGGI
jgi:hypothetical protein